MTRFPVSFHPRDFPQAHLEAEIPSFCPPAYRDFARRHRIRFRGDSPPPFRVEALRRVRREGFQDHPEHSPFIRKRVQELLAELESQDW